MHAWARAWAGIQLGLQTDACNRRALKQQSKWMQSRDPGAATEVDTIGEQLKRGAVVEF